MKKYAIILGLASLAACAPVVLKTPAQSDADKLSAKYPNTTLQELNEGKKLYEENCNRCHSLKKALSKSEATLVEEVPRMAKKAKVDDRSKDLILKYLLSTK